MEHRHKRRCRRRAATTRQPGVSGRHGRRPVPGRHRADVPGQREIQVRDPVPGIVRRDPEPDALPPDVRVMPCPARLRCHVHRQVHALVIGVPELLGDLVAGAGPPVKFAEAPLDLVVGERLRGCRRASASVAGMSGDVGDDLAEFPAGCRVRPAAGLAAQRREFTAKPGIWPHRAAASVAPWSKCGSPSATRRVTSTPASAAASGRRRLRRPLPVGAHRDDAGRRGRQHHHARQVHELVALDTGYWTRKCTCSGRAARPGPFGRSRLLTVAAVCPRTYRQLRAARARPPGQDGQGREALIRGDDELPQGGRAPARGPGC
jgi:hypothetical protein